MLVSYWKQENENERASEGSARHARDMNRIGLAVGFVIVATVAILAEVRSPAWPVIQSWMVANAGPPKPEPITVVEIGSSAQSGMIGSLDAALVLRSIFPYEPQGVVFLDPIARDNDASLLEAKLGDARVPVVFTGDSGLSPLPHVALASSIPLVQPSRAWIPAGFPAGCERAASGQQVALMGRSGERVVPSNVLRFFLAAKGLPLDSVRGAAPGILEVGKYSFPVDAGGLSSFEPRAARLLERIAYSDLLLRTEHSEEGEISTDLDATFRSRVIAVQLAGGMQPEGLAALFNHLLTTASVSPWLSLAGLVIAASLPWWGVRRRDRMVLALIVGCSWVLLALALFGEFALAAPMSIAFLLPLMALVPVRPAGLPHANDARKAALLQAD